jgi:hypothetical protein
LKANYVGIIGAIIAFISFALPWWSGTSAATNYGDVYLYQTTGTASMIASLNLWYGWIALALMIIAGLLGIVSSVTAFGKKLLVGGGVLALLSIIIFAAGLQMDLSSASGGTVGLFSAPDGSAYLSYGFWLALVSAIIMFVAIKTQPVEKAPAPQPPT